MTQDNGSRCAEIRSILQRTELNTVNLMLTQIQYILGLII